MGKQEIYKLHRQVREVGEADLGQPAGTTLEQGPIIRNISVNPAVVLGSDNTGVRRSITRRLNDSTVLPVEATYNRIPIIAQQNIPAGYPLAVMGAMFAGAPHSNAIFSNIQANGGDLRAFSDEAMTQELPVELVNIDTGANALVAGVRIPSAITSGNPACYLRTTIAGGQTLPAIDSTYGANNVWQDYLLATWDCLKNSVNGATMTATGGAALSGASLLNGLPARGLGATDGVASGDRVGTGITTNFVGCTISALVYAHNNFQTMMFRDTAEYHRWYIQTSQLHYQRRWNTSNVLWRMTGAVALSQWIHCGTHYAGALTTDDAVHYEDGAAESTVESLGPPSGTPPDVTGEIFLGARFNGGYASDMRMSCFRARTDAKDAAWLALEAANLQNPTSVATAGALVQV